MHAPYRIGRRLLLWAAVLAAAIGCDEPSTRASRTLTGPLDIEAPPVDDAIDPSDSYATTDVVITGSLTISSPEPMLDPASGELVETLTIDAPADTVHFQTGYDAVGRPVTVTRFRQDPASTAGDPNDVALTRIIDTVATDYAADGHIVSDSPEEAAEGPSPVAQLAALPGGAFGGVPLVDAIAPSGGVEPLNIGASEPLATVSTSAPPSVTATVLATTPSPIAGTTGAPAATRVESRSATELRLLTESAGEGGAWGRVRRRYGRTAGQWVLAEVAVEQGIARDGFRGERRSLMRFSNVRVHRSASRDRARSGARAARPRGAGGAGIGRPLPRGPLSFPVGDVASEPTVTVPAGLATPAPPMPRASLAMEPPYPGSIRPDCDPLTAPHIVPGPLTKPGLVLQHGLWSDACTWRRMEDSLRARFRTGFGPIVVHSTSNTAPYDAQRDQLVDVMHRSGGTDWVLIGHSNGGIVARRTAQRWVQNGGKVRGVITINSPHDGAPAMRLALGAARSFYRAITAPFWYLCKVPERRGCLELKMLTDESSFITRLAALQKSGVHPEMVPASPFRATLNAVPEPFLKVGIVSNPSQRWLWARMYGDARCWPEETCGGREQAHRTNRFFRHLTNTALLSALIGSVATLVGATEVAGQALSVGRAAGTLAIMLAVADIYYRRIVAPNDDSDGIVPRRSQLYPRSSRLVHVPSADSHVGSTASGYVIERVRVVLRDPVLFAVTP